MNYQRTATRVALIAVLLGLMTISASATHFRYGTIRWQPTGISNQIQFTLQASYRRGFSGFTPANPIVGQTLTLLDVFNFGDGTTTTPSFVVTSINAGEDWVIASATFTKTYASAGNRTAFFTNCCRLSALQLSMNDQDYRLETIVNVGTTNRSPVSSTLPFVRLIKANPVHFFVQATDPDNDDITYRLATAAEYDGTPSGAVAGAGTLPVGLSINASTGEITWNTSSLTTNALYAIQVIVEDRDANNLVRSKIPVDFIIQIINPVPNLPTIALSPAGTETVVSGTEISFTITGTDTDAGAVVTLSGSGVPSGADISPAFPNSGSNPRVSTFTWTPVDADAGSHAMTFAATDEFGQQALTSKTIIVTLNTPPEADAGDDRTEECTGGTYELDGSGSSDADSDALTYLWEDDLGNDLGTDAVINVSLPLGSHTFTLTVDDGTETESDDVTITVADTEDPAADAATLETATGTCSASITSAPTATDACGGSIIGTTDDELSYDDQGTYDVEWTYDDGNGNTSTQTQQVIVTGADPVPDVAVLPVVEGECSAEVTAPTATSECFGTITGTTTDPTSYSSQGTYTVHWTYEDENGNSAEQDQTVIVDDNTAPTITVTLSPNTLWPPNNAMHDIAATIVLSDNCPDNTLTVELESIASDESGTGQWDNATLNTDDRAFRLKAKRDGGGDGRTYTATYSVSDGNGNSGTGFGTCNVPHSQGNGKRVVDVASGEVLSMTQVFPNPSSSTMTVAYTLARAAHVVIDIVDINGVTVRSLVNGIQNTGTTSAIWNCRNDRSVDVPSGTYLVRMSIDDETVRTERIVLRR